jgi:hypothetical protein
MSDVFITKSNFSKVAQKAIGNLEEGIQEICSRVYGFKDISKYLNGKEIRDIECKRLLLEDSGKYISKFLEENKLIILKRKNNAQFSPYIFVSTAPPKYHLNKDCTFLSTDYINFYIPPEINERGADEIERFRDFAIVNRQLLVDGKEDIFIARLKIQFRLVCDMSKISFLNSGVDSFIFGNDCDVAKRIDEVMAAIDSIGQTDAGSKLLRQYIYMDHYKVGRREVQEDKIVLKILTLKGELINLLIKFHLMSHSKSGFSFDRAGRWCSILA